MGSNQSDALLGAVARRRGGVFTRGEALAAGVPAAEVARRIASGLWVAEFGVGLRAATTPVLTGTREIAALARAGAGAVLSHFSAARWWRLGLPVTDDVWVTVPYRRNPREVPGMRVVRTHALPPSAIVRHNGLPMTTPDRTIADLARSLTERDLTAVLLAAIQRRLCTAETVARWLTVLPHRAGNATLAAALAVADPGLESILAAEFQVLVDRAGIPLVAGYRLRLPTGEQVVCDFADLQTRIDFEVDGAAYHGAPHQVARDKRRDRRLSRHGWHTARYDTDAVRRDQTETVRDVRAQIAQRLKDLGLISVNS